MDPWLQRTLSLIFPNAERRSLPSTLFRAAALLFITIWSLHYFTVSVHDLGEDPGWMHRVHLVFHEAGHAITAMVTDYRDLIVFMGSGLQVLFPLIVAGAFYWTNADGFGAALGLWWTGHSVLDVSPYIADARALDLQLLAGGTGKEIEGHDWEYLLTQWNVISLDTQIAARVALAGRLIMGLALCWAAITLIYDRFVLIDDEGPQA